MSSVLPVGTFVHTRLTSGLTSVLLLLPVVRDAHLHAETLVSLPEHATLPHWGMLPEGQNRLPTKEDPLRNPSSWQALDTTQGQRVALAVAAEEATAAQVSLAQISSRPAPARPAPDSRTGTKGRPARGDEDVGVRCRACQTV